MLNKKQKYFCGFVVSWSMRFQLTSLFFCLALLFSVHTNAQRVGIGEWDSYFNFSRTLDVVEADKKIVWISDLSALYYDQEDLTINPLNKIHGLSQTGLSKLGYNRQTKTIVLGYLDGNLDLVNFDENNKITVVNMSDIKRSSITGDKKIYHLFSYNQFVYVSCGFGIVVIDTDKKEVKDTYIIGASSSQIRINGVTIGNDTIYAGTENGMYKAYLNNPFLNYYASWSKVSDIPSWLSSKEFKAPAFINNRLYAIPDYADYGQDTAYYRSGSTWTKLPILSGIDVNAINPLTDGRFVISTTQNTTLTNDSFTVLGDVFNYGTSGETVVIVNSVFSSKDNLFYIADNALGPLRCPNSYAYENLSPGGTKSASVRRVTTDGKSLWVAAGSVGGSIYSSNFNTDFFSIKEGNNWSYINRTTDAVLFNNAYDLLDVAIDPNDENHVYGALWSMHGLAEIQNKTVTSLYDETNSPLFSPPGYPDFCGVASVEFDDESNLWCLNGQSPNPLVVKKADGTWKTFYCGSSAAERTYGDIVIDKDLGYKYIPFPTRGTQPGGLVIYDDKGTIDDATDDEYKTFNGFDATGHFSDADVRCVMVDLDGEVWVGTNQGPAVIYNPSGVFNNTSTPQHILIEQDGNAQYLLETETITAIDIDGANRKWLGTENSGAFLLSEDGQEQIAHFTIDNSPLPSNTILDIEIDGKTGEVFFATANGLISYRGTATKSNATFDNVKVFPNPVRPDYTGPIALNGLSRDSDVKITDVAGNIVNVIKSEGGQAIWYGTNLKGESVKSGVYLFLCSNSEGSEKVAAKVMIIR